MTLQHTLFGESKFMGTDREKAIYILTHHPEVRNNYKAGVFWWHTTFDGLGPVLRTQETLDRYKEWLCSRRATSPHTIRNRIQEVQNDFDHLDACEEVEEWRQKRSKAGVLS